MYAVQVFGGDKAKLRKTDNLKNEVAGLEAAVQAAAQEYDRVKLRNTQVWLHTDPRIHVRLSVHTIIKITACFLLLHMLCCQQGAADASA